MDFVFHEEIETMLCQRQLRCSSDLKLKLPPSVANYSPDMLRIKRIRGPVEGERVISSSHRGWMDCIGTETRSFVLLHALILLFSQYGFVSSLLPEWKIRSLFWTTFHPQGSFQPCHEDLPIFLNAPVENTMLMMGPVMQFLIYQSVSTTQSSEEIMDESIDSIFPCGSRRVPREGHVRCRSRLEK